MNGIMNRKTIPAFLICLFAFLTLAVPVNGILPTKKSDIEKTFGKKDKVICVSIPKAGTHLLIKCLTLLEVDGITYNYDTEKFDAERTHRPYAKITLEEYGDRAFSRLTYRMERNHNIRRSYLIHLPFHKKYRPFFKNNTIANFLMVRDPRDQLISLASTSLKDPKNREEYLETILLDLIEGKQRLAPWERRHGACDLMWTVGIVNFYKTFLAWAKEPHFQVVRFENLIGPMGGGTVEQQKEEIRKIGLHIGVFLSEEKIQYVVDNLYGETRTFSKGQAKAWKKYFTPEVTKAFKKVPGSCQLLVDLGYESSCDW